MGDQEEDYSSLPLPDRFAHKNWKVRKEAYEAAAKEFDNAQTESDPVVRQFVQDSNLWKGAVSDSNVAAHQEALSALCSFLQAAGTQGCTRTRNLTIGPLAEKGLPSTKPAAKQSALEAILLYIELDKADPVIEELLPLLSHKTPKVIAATLSALTAIYHAYGCKTVDPKPVLKQLPKAYGHADKNVRAEAQNLTVELYRWLKEGMKPIFWNELKPVQQQDLEKLFEPIKNEPPPKPERLLRSEQAKVAAAAATPAAAEEEDVDDVEEEGDGGFDLEPDPVDIMPKVPKDLQERLASTKWKDRKDVLDELHATLDVPLIQDGPFDDIIRGLAKSMKDANIAVVTVAANCVELLAKGLRKHFAKYRSSIMGPMMERLKERKQTVTDALGVALDAVFACTSLPDCLEETLGFLQNKNPQVKLESTKFLVRCLKSTKEAPTIPEVKQISDVATKLLTDSQETQRNAAAEVLGVLLKIMGERIMNTHFEGLDDIRKAKIKEYCDSAEVKAKYKPKAAAPPPKPPAAAGKKPPAKKPAAAATTPAAKKPAAPPPVVEEPAAAPLQPKPTARPGLPKPGVRGIKPPSGSGIAPPGKKLPQPGASQAQSSPRRNVQSPPLEEEHTPAPKPARGLTGRPLGKPAEPVQPPPPTEPSGGLSSIERVELDELRAEVERLRSANEGLRAEHLKLTSQVHELQDQNAQLIEDHTRDVLTIKAKETQLVRARSDAESAEQTSSQLQREVDRLKRELSRMGRANSPRINEYGGGAADIFPDSRYGAVNGGPAAPADPLRNRRISPTSGTTEGKENIVVGDLEGLSEENRKSSVLSPRSAGLARPPSSSSRTHSESQSPVRPPSVRSANSQNAAIPNQSISGGGGANGGAPAPSFTEGEVRTSTSGSGGSGQGQESWRRAAEVTQNLKARIELMRQRQGMSGR